VAYGDLTKRSGTRLPSSLSLRLSMSSSEIPKPVGATDRYLKRVGRSLPGESEGSS